MAKRGRPPHTFADKAEALKDDYIVVAEKKSLAGVTTRGLTLDVCSNPPFWPERLKKIKRRAMEHIGSGLHQDAVRACSPQQRTAITTLFSKSSWTASSISVGFPDGFD